MLIDCGMSEFSEQGSRERLEWVASGCCVGGAERSEICVFVVVLVFVCGCFVHL